MIELPEAVTLAQQMNVTLRGQRIVRGERGNAPHKFAFYNRPPEEYEAILADQVVGEAAARGSCITLNVGPDHHLVLGFGGERIRYHTDARTVPQKHQLLLEFAGGGHLSVTVQGWGFAQLWAAGEGGCPYAQVGATPLDAAFTREHFESLFEGIPETDPRSVKAFLITQPGVPGVGNGYLQDILFAAKLHPRRRVTTLGEPERAALYDALLDTLDQAAALGGRDTEKDLHDQPGRYRATMDRRAVGQPCPCCGTAIEKAAFLGGSVYTCPTCQA